MWSKHDAFLNLLVVSLVVSLILGLATACRAQAADSVVATVNNIPIMKSELDHLVMQYLTKTGKKTVTRETRRNLLKNLIRHQLILQQALVQALRKDEEIAEKVKQYEDSLVIAKFLQNQLSDQLKESELELMQFYKENIENFKTPEQVEARHILHRTLEEAEDTLSKLKNGEDFAQLAEQYSIDLPNALKGGEMGRIKRGDILPELEKVLFDLREGQISGVIPTRFGYHILTVDKIIPAKTRPFAQVKDEIRKAVFRQKRDKAFEEMVTKLEKKAHIEIIEERLLFLFSRTKSTDPFSLQSEQIKTKLVFDS